jgi:hypothetical protein
VHSIPGTFSISPSTVTSSAPSDSASATYAGVLEQDLADAAAGHDVVAETRPVLAELCGRGGEVRDLETEPAPAPGSGIVP